MSKIEKVKPKHFFICTSMRLTRGNINKIFDIFNEYMVNIDHIFDGTRIDEFLQLKENKELVVKNYKLWMVATNVLSIINSQDIIIDGDVLLDDINTKKNFYIKTDFYNLALKTIYKDKAILIVGDPGVGKTTISNMLVLALVGRECRVRYSSGNDIGAIKRSLTEHPNIKELVYIDDFLGQSYLDLKSNYMNELHSLVAHIKRCNNKFIILNSRITIHKEALDKQNKYLSLLENVKISVLDINKMSLLDKAKIFYNHLYFNEIDAEHFEAIRKQKNYIKIIKHPNYNPRLIEYVTKKGNITFRNNSDYYEYIKENFDNPKEIWANEFLHRLEAVDRIFMNTLFSLSNENVSLHVFKETFDKRLISEKGIETTKDVYTAVCRRLSENLVKIIDYKGEHRISDANPSINDYLKKSLSENIPEINKILENAVYIEQFESFIRELYKSQEMRDLVKTKRLFSLKYIVKSIGYHYIRYLNENNIMLINDKLTFVNAIENIKTKSIESTEVSNIIVSLLTKDFIISNDILFDVSETKLTINILDMLTIDDCKRFGCVILEMLKENGNKADLFFKLLSEQLIKKYQEYFNDKLHDRGYDIINDLLCNEYNHDYIISYTVKKMAEYFYDLIDDTFPCLIFTGYSLIYDLSEFDILSCIDFDGMLDSCKEDYYSDEQYSHLEENEYAKDPIEIMIDSIFNR